MTSFNEAHKDILDDISREVDRPGAKVRVSISIDGDGAGVVKFDALLTRATMAGVMDLINALEAEQKTKALRL